MIRCPIEWRFDSNRIKSSVLELNAEWTLECLMYTIKKLHNPYSKPVRLRICRNYIRGDDIIYGKLNICASPLNKTRNVLCGNSTLLHEWKFNQLLTDGRSFAHIDLDFELPVSMRNMYLSYVISGVIFIFKDTEFFIDEMEEQLPVSEGARIADSGNTTIIDTNEFNSLKNLSEDMMHLFDEGSSFADVVLECESFSVPAHKSILSARSPVFSAMFKTEMKESREETVDIIDMDISVLQTMLVYIYSGNTDGLSMSNAHDLLFAADKYQLIELKKVCSKFLRSNANDQNILNILVFGYLHDLDLKDFAVSFICNEVEDFSVLENSEEWKRLCEEISTLAIEVSVAFIKTKEEKWNNSNN
ncbi:speckle-type POZ protein B [Nephila pilipes]|uniref:Speckle-type POZ protein B n=1 Tax=Nephila pilipes TaxID=299642 RepID=A0A8X6QPK5_NEPPI|nr:speckle-type POZ protein B [Nephila pilipes]